MLALVLCKPRALPPMNPETDQCMAGWKRAPARWPWRFRLDWRKQSAFVPAASRRRSTLGERQRPPRSQLIPQTYPLSPPSLPLFLPSFLPFALSTSLSAVSAHLHGWLSDRPFERLNECALYLESGSLTQSEGEGECDEPRSHRDGICGCTAGFGRAAVFVGVGADAGAVRHHVRDVSLLVRRVEKVRHGPGREDAHVRPSMGF